LHGHSSIPPAAALTAGRAGFCRENEERALDKLDTAPPAEFPRASRPTLKRLASLDKLFIISVLQVFAFYAPFSDVHASHI